MINTEKLKIKSDVVWDIANLLRGPYRPPQYRKVMIPLTVFKRLDSVVEEKGNKQAIIDTYNKYISAGDHDEETIEKIINSQFKMSYYNTSKFSFNSLLNDPDNLASNLINYLAGFSPRARNILDRFKFEEEIYKLDEADRLYKVLSEIALQDFHPNNLSNLEMGYIFEDLVRRFNEQANEEAGDHFTPREVIKLMVNILFTGQEGIYNGKKNIRIYDPTAGTGGMLSESEKHILNQNSEADIHLYGQEYNPESYAICGSDLMIKGEDTSNIVFGDTLGTGRIRDGIADGDGHPNETFHYMLANPPFGVEWKPEKDYVTQEHQKAGFNGRFGPGLPRINDGALLFLLHMISKGVPSPEEGGEGTRIAVVFNGSPLFTGDAGSGESNIRRWIIENDMLEAVIGLPNQLFYNTGIFTYIWIVTNRKNQKRKGTIQLINGTDFAIKMKKSLGDKRNKIGEGTDNEPNHIDHLTQIYANYQHNETRTISQINTNVEPDKKKKRDPNTTIPVSKIFKNQDFGYLKITVERPLRQNYTITTQRINAFKTSSYYTNLATSKKRKKDKTTQQEIQKEILQGKQQQQAIITVLENLKPHFANNAVIKNRKTFEKQLKDAFTKANIKWDASLKKALLSKDALATPDPTGDICKDSKGNPEADSDLRDTENVSLPEGISLPLPLDYGDKANNEELIKLVKEHCEAYLKKEVLPYRPDAWIDFSKTKVGYEIPFNRHFYQYEPPRPLEDIEKDIKALEDDILKMLSEVV